MAAKETRIVVTLACQECKQRNYATTKNRQHNPDRLQLQKFCRWCGKHTEHREAK